MNKFNLIGTVKNLEKKQFKKGNHIGTILKFQITYPINNRKMTTFSCSTFSETIVKGLKNGDYIELVDYVPTSDKFLNNQGQYQYFNSLIVKEIQWKNNIENIGELEQEMIFGDFDVNSYQENYGEEEALVDVPKDIDYLGMLQVQEQKMQSQPIEETEFEVILKDE